MCLEPARDVYSQGMSRLNNIIKVMKQSSGFDGAMMDGIVKSKDELNQAFYFNILYGNNRDPEVKDASITFISEFLTSGHASFWSDVYNNLSNKEKESFYGKQLGDRSKISVGQPFPEFVLPESSGKDFVFKDMVSKNKITVIHFWAENSIDRKAYQDELLFLYKKYHDKGFNIIGFSTDKYVDQWKEALEREKYPWYNVIDTKGLNGLAKKVYHEYSTDFYNNYLIHNTTNILVDQQGKIIAWDVSGPELQYYLWKNLENQ
jgi:glutathione peroxidase-family protein